MVTPARALRAHTGDSRKSSPQLSVSGSRGLASRVNFLLALLLSLFSYVARIFVEAVSATRTLIRQTRRREDVAVDAFVDVYRRRLEAKERDWAEFVGESDSGSDFSSEPDTELTPEQQAALDPLFARLRSGEIGRHEAANVLQSWLVENAAKAANNHAGAKRATAVDVRRQPSSQPHTVEGPPTNILPSDHPSVVHCSSPNVLLANTADHAHTREASG